MNFEFVIKSLMIGVGLASDASAVAITNGVNEKGIKKSKIFVCSFLFAIFQGVMPLIGFIASHSLLFLIENWLSWISFCILTILGVNMILNCKNDKDTTLVKSKLNLKILIMQAFATSIDALSLGIVIANYKISQALLCSLIIFLVTFALCFFAFLIGKTFGKNFGNKSMLIGGIVLMLVGLHIFFGQFIWVLFSYFLCFCNLLLVL